MQKALSQTDQALAADILAQPRAARAEHDQVGRQVKLVDVMELQEAVFSAAALVEHRQYDAGQFRMLAIDYPVRGEVDDAIVVQFTANRQRAVRLEPCNHARLASRGDLHNGLCLLKRER